VTPPAGGDAVEGRLVVRRPTGFTLDVRLTLPAGRTVALLGPNGAGKSTAVRALAGLRPLDDGHLAFGSAVWDDPGKGLFLPPEARRIGVVFQDGVLFPHLSAEENVAFGLRARSDSPEEARAVARRWLDRVGLGDAGPRRPSDLSGGEAQRVALARALATDPEVLLLDEPLSALDVHARGGVRRLLEEHLSAFTGPRLLITHDPDEAFQLAAEIHVLEGGRITQSGSADDLRFRPRTPYAAEMGGTNLVPGRARSGLVDTGSLTLQVPAASTDGPVRLAIRPSAVAVHSDRPVGSPRNTWSTVLERVDEVGGRVRLRTGDPLRLMVEVTRSARDELALERGTMVWLAVKATDIGVEAG